MLSHKLLSPLIRDVRVMLYVVVAVDDGIGDDEDSCWYDEFEGSRNGVLGVTRTPDKNL